MASREREFVRKALWFANSAPVDLKGLYRKLNVYPPLTTFVVKFDPARWRADLETAGDSEDEKLVLKHALELRDWMRAQLSKVATENLREHSHQSSKKAKGRIRVNFNSPTVNAGEALDRTIRGNTKVPLEAFVLYAMAILTSPDMKWRRWLRACRSCGKVFYAERTGGARSWLCSPKCKKLQNAVRVDRHRNKRRAMTEK